MPRKRTWKVSKAKTGDANPKKKRQKCLAEVDGEETVLFKNSKTNLSPKGKTNEIVHTRSPKGKTNEIVNTRSPKGKTNEILNTRSLKGKTNEILNTRSLKGKTNEISDLFLKGNATELSNKLSNELSNELTSDIICEQGLACHSLQETLPQTKTLCTSGNYSLNGNESQGEREINMYQHTENKLHGGLNEFEIAETCHYCQPSGKTMKHAIWASFSQSSSRFSEVSRDRQCTCNAIIFLLYFKTTHTFTTSVLDKILVKGDDLYSEIIESLKSNTKFMSYLLKFEDLPNTLQIESFKYKIVKYNPIWGTITDAPNYAYAQSLDSAIINLLEGTGMGLIIAGAICSALLKHGNSYYFFDSHSHGFDTLPSAGGKAVLLVFHEYHDLMSYLYASFEYLGIPCNFQFEILPLSVEQLNSDAEVFGKKRLSTSFKDDAGTDLIDLSTYFRYQEQMEARHREISSRHKDRVPSEQNIYILGKPKQVKVNSSKQTSSVKKISRDLHRKQYRKKYMQMRRENPEYRKVERVWTSESMKKARKNPEYRKVDKVRTSESMKKARKNPEYRKVDKVRTSESMKKARKNPEYIEMLTKCVSESMKEQKEMLTNA